MCMEMIVVTEDATKITTFVNQERLAVRMMRTVTTISFVTRKMGMIKHSVMKPIVALSWRLFSPITGGITTRVESESNLFKLKRY